MSDITIGRWTQRLLLLAIVSAVGALASKQIPEIQRYLKIRSM